MMTNEMITGYNYAITDILQMFAENEDIEDEKLKELLTDSIGIVEQGKKEIARKAITDYLREARKKRIDGE